MAAALTLLLIGCLLQSVHCGEFKVTMPQTIEVLNGSCVTIPCSFDIEDKHMSNLGGTCKAMWRNEQGTVVFDSSNPQWSTIKGHLTGDLTKRDCTTTLNNMQPEHSNKYYLRVECDYRLKQSFIEQKLDITVKADPPRPTLTPSTLEVEEGTSVSLKCSAPAPCLSHPPTLTWTPSLGHSQETLEENQDKTKVKTSVVNFTASHLHHRQEISCTAVYNKQDGSTESSVSTSLTANISCPFKIIMPQTIEVLKGSSVTIPCSFCIKDEFRTNLDRTCKAVWKNKKGTVVFDSSNPQSSTIKGKLTGDLTKRDCTTTLNNMQPEHINKYYLRVECDNPLKYDFKEPKLDIKVKDSPKHTTVSVSPSGPVPEDSNVTLTCSSTANPAVRNYTWYRADGGQETFIGTGRVLNMKASEVSGPFFCKAENDLGAGLSNISQIDVQFAPQILFSSDCTKTADQLNCSCETVGKPSPTLQWYLDELPVNHSDKFAISNEPLNETSLRIIITVNQPQWRNLSTLFCRSSNSLGSATQRFYVYSLEPQTSAQCHDQVTLTVFIIIVVVLLVLVLVLVLVCALLLVRAQKTRHNLSKGTVAMSQLLTSGEGNEVPNTTEDNISINASVLRQEDVAHPAAVSESNNADSPSSGPNNAEGANKNSEKKNEGGSDVVYASVNWKSKSKKKKKEEDAVDMDQPGGSYLEEERCMVGGMSRKCVSNALEMGSLYDEVEPRNVKKEVECEYAQVQFKKKK